MLLRAHELEHYSLQAADGELGSVNRLYIEQATWVARYLVVGTGLMELGQEVLVSMYAVRQVDHDAKRITVSLTKEQILNAPPAVLDLPLSRTYEREYLQFYGWPAYWEQAGGTIGGRVDTPAEVLARVPAEAETIQLMNSDDLAACRVQAIDGEVGDLDDILLDTDDWRVPFLEMDVGHWWAGRKVLIPTDWITGMDWNDMRIDVGLRIGQIQSAPEYRSDTPIDAAYDGQLRAHYGEPPQPALSYDDRIGGLNTP